MIDLRSDTVTMPSKKMKDFIFNAPLGDDVYGEDPSINSLEEKIADLFGKESSLFVPSGTMANLISVLTHCERGDEVLLGDKSHIFFYESGGISAFGGIHSHQIKNELDGTININAIKNRIRDSENIHFPTTKLMCLENTHNLCYGAPINSSYIKSVKTMLNNFNIKLHIDGARIFNASVALKMPVNELCVDSDSITCCLSKGLSAPAGSLVIGSKTFINKARKIRKALGGGMRQAGIIASAGIFAIENMIERLEEDHFNAKKLADNMSNISEININNENVFTNIVFFNLNKCQISDADFMLELLNNKIKIDYKGNHKFRMVLHSGINKNQILKVIETFKNILKK